MNGMREKSHGNGKKLLALEGSPQPHGVTASLLEQFLAQAGRHTEIVRFSPWKTPLTPCNGCGHCFSAPGCVKRDGDAFFKVLEDADFLVVATPVYLLSFPAPLKAVFDRFEQYYGARFGRQVHPAIGLPKRAFFIITAGSESHTGAQMILRQARMAFSVMNIQLEGCFFLPDTDHMDGPTLARRLDELKTQAVQFYHARFF